MGQFEDMQTFIAIVETDTMRQAAEKLSIAKSALSRRLAELESRLNVQLLNRTTRKSSLTDSGHRYYRRACQIVSDVDELHARTANARAALEGDLRIALPHSFGQMHLAPAIIEFAKLHPAININLSFSDRQIDLLEEGVDVAIRIADLKDSSLKARKLAPINLVLCAGEKYLAQYGYPQSPDDLKHCNMLNYTSTSSSQSVLESPDGKKYPLRLSSKMSANNGEFLCSAVAEGLGVSILPTFIVWKHLRDGTLVHLLPDYTIAGINAYAVYPQTPYLSQRVRLIIDFLAQKFAGTPFWDAQIARA